MNVGLQTALYKYMRETMSDVALSHIEQAFKDYPSRSANLTFADDGSKAEIVLTIKMEVRK